LVSPNKLNALSLVVEDVNGSAERVAIYNLEGNPKDLLDFTQWNKNDH
jgi:hypothetical protein